MAPWLCLMCLIHFNTIWIHLNPFEVQETLKQVENTVLQNIVVDLQQFSTWPCLDIPDPRVSNNPYIWGKHNQKDKSIYIYTWIIMDSFESRSVTSPIPIFILIHTSPICSSHIFPHEKPWVLPNDLLWGPRDDGWSAAAFAPSVFPGAGFGFGGDLGGAP